MKTTSIITGLILIVLLYSCERSQNEETTYKNTDASSTVYGNSNNATESKNEVSTIGFADANYSASSNATVLTADAVRVPAELKRKFIRTADLKFRVCNVDSTTSDIENIIVGEGGFVTYTNLTSRIDKETNTAVSEDSALKSTYYTVTNHITVRVANSRLDTALKQIARNIEYLDYRVIKADDVALQMLANDIARERNLKYQRRMSRDIDDKGRRLNHIIEGENQLADRQAQSDDRLITNKSLSDQIQFSTIQLSIYQPEQIRRELLANDKNITGYEPGFGQKIVDSLSLGWNVLQAILLFIAKIWALIIFSIFGILYYRFNRGKINSGFGRIQSANSSKE